MRRFFKGVFILIMPVLVIFLALLNIATVFKYENEKISEERIQKILNDYDGTVFVKYKPTLFSIYNRGGFKIKNNIDNLIYEKEPDMREILEVMKKIKFKASENVIIDENIRNISCKTDMREAWFSTNNCLSIFEKITEKRLEYLKQIELKNIYTEISYNFSETDESFWTIKIAKDRHYELKFSEMHKMRIKASYGLELPKKVYGILTEEQFKKLDNLNIKKITTDDEKGLGELSEIFPFIDFSYRYKDVVNVGDID